MGLRLKNQEYGSCFFITTSFIDRRSFGVIDGVYEAIAEAISFRVNKTKSKLMAYVLMPSHIHLLLLIDGNKLSGFMRDFKKYTSQKSLKRLCKSRNIWQSRYDSQAIWSYDLLIKKVEYIHNNPVKSGLVDNSEKWYYSSTVDYIKNTNGPIGIWKEWY